MQARIVIGPKPKASQDGVPGICYFRWIAAKDFNEGPEMREFDVAAISEVLHFAKILSRNPAPRNFHVDPGASWLSPQQDVDNTEVPPSSVFRLAPSPVLEAFVENVLIYLDTILSRATLDQKRGDFCSGNLERASMETCDEDWLSWPQQDQSVAWVEHRSRRSFLQNQPVWFLIS